MVLLGRNAAAVVVDADDVAGLDRDKDSCAVSCQRLVDRVVHDLINKVMQTRNRGGADVHAGALAHGFQSLEDLDLRFVVGIRYFQIKRILVQGQTSDALSTLDKYRRDRRFTSVDAEIGEI